MMPRSNIARQSVSGVFPTSYDFDMLRLKIARLGLRSAICVMDDVRKHKLVGTRQRKIPGVEGNSLHKPSLRYLRTILWLELAR
jgi:hypothetical protein